MNETDNQANLPPFTGERVVPDRPEIAELYREHLVRYLFASQFCSGRTVLDAACGLGYGTELLARAGAHKAIGIDIAPDAIAYAQARYGSHLVRFAVADCAVLPLKSRSVDLVVSFETIEHIPDAVRFVAEIRRVVSPDGLVVMSTPNRAIFPPGNPFHVKEFSQEEFLDLLRQFFPHVELYAQDAPAMHRISAIKRTPPDPVRTTEYAAFIPPGMEAENVFFVALCAANPLPIQPLPAIVPAANHSPGGSIGEQNRSLAAELENLRQHSANLSHELDNLRRHSANLERERDDLQQRSANQARELDNFRQHNAGVEREIDNLQRHSANLERERDDLRQHSANQAQELENLRQHNAHLEHERDDLWQRSANQTQELDNLRQHSANLEHERDDLRQHSANLEHELDDLRQHNANLKQEFDNLRRHSANLDDALLHLRKWNADLLAQQTVLTAEIERYRSDGSPFLRGEALDAPVDPDEIDRTRNE